jgi:hypothetical protein
MAYGDAGRRLSLLPLSSSGEHPTNMPRLPEVETYSEKVSFNLSRRQLALVRKLARQNGQRFTVWIRERVAEALHVAKPERAAARPLSPPSLPSK